MNRSRRLLPVLALALLAAPLAWGLAAEIAGDRDAAWIAAVREAELRVPHKGRRVVTHPGAAPVVVSSAHDARVPAGARWMGYLRDGGPARFGDPDLVVRNYRLVRAGSGVLAGRPVEHARLEPRHPGRASYAFSVDAATRLPLAFTATGPGGALLYDTRYESVEFGASPARPRVLRGVERTPVAEHDLRGLTPFTAFAPRWLPAGFVRGRLEIWRVPRFGESLLGVYTDGMSTLLVAQVDCTNPGWRFVRGYLGLGELPGTDEDGARVVHRIRHAGGTLLDLAADGTEILVGGSLDTSDLERVAANLEPLGN